MEERVYNPKFYTDEDIKGKSGIYQIRNLLNGKIYVGSAIELIDRKKGHFSDLKYKHHHNDKLQEEYNVYGEQNFIFEIIEFCDKNIRYKIEQQWLNKFFGKDYCYNRNPKAVEPPVHYGANNPRAKTVICLNDGNIFKTIKDCLFYYNIDRSGVNKNIRGYYINPKKRFTLLTIYEAMLKDGYTKEYILENYSNIIYKYDYLLEHVQNKTKIFGKDNHRAVSVICLDDKKEFGSIRECYEYYNKDRSGVTKNCEGEYINPKLRFMYLDLYNKLLQLGFDEDYIYKNHYVLKQKYKI